MNDQRKECLSFGSAKVCLNSKEYMKSIRYVTKALHLNRQFNYYLFRSQVYATIGSEMALRMALNDCINAKQLKQTDNKVCDLENKIKSSLDRVLALTGGQSAISSDNNWLLSIQELTENILNEKSGNGCEIQLIEYYCRRSVCYDRIGSIESKRLSVEDIEKCKRFKAFNEELVSNCIRDFCLQTENTILIPVPHNPSASKAPVLMANQFKSNTSCEAVTADDSDDEIYFSDEEYD